MSDLDPLNLNLTPEELELQEQLLAQANSNRVTNPQTPRPRLEETPKFSIEEIEEQRKALEKIEQQRNLTAQASMNIQPVDLLSLPWSATTEDIEDFLHGVNITKVVEGTERTRRTDLPMLQVLIVLNSHHKPSGEARVWVSSEAEAEKAVARSGQNLGSRRVVVR